MKALLSLPLHYQILVAMLLGSVLGVVVNPGSTDLGIDVFASLSTDGKTIQLREANTSGEVFHIESFANLETLAAKYPGLATEYTNAGVTPEKSHKFAVASPTAEFVRTDAGLNVRYARRHLETPAVATTSVSSVADLASETSGLHRVVSENMHGTSRSIVIWAKRIGDLFLRLLKMITVPLIMTSLITGVAGLGEPGRFGRMFGRTILYYASTSVLAITTGLLLVNIIRPGVGAILPGGGHVVAGEDQSLTGIFLGLLNKMIPTNPFAAIAGGEFLSIITFSILFGICIIYTGGRPAEVLREFFAAAFEVIMKLTMAIIALAPIGVFAFMLFATATQGLDVFRTLAWYMLTVFLALLVHATLVLPLVVRFIAKRSPLRFAEAMSPALLTAFSTASSNAALPLTMTSVENRAGVSNRVSSFVLPLGATLNMDGTALYEAVAVLFIAQATPGFDLTLTSQITVAVTALLASIGAAGIPHAGLVMMAIVLQAVGLPLEAQGIILAVDRVLDMCRTTVNVWSDSCGCAVLSQLDGGAADAPISTATAN